MNRRAFALAIVVVLGAIVVIMSGVMIQRHGAARLNVDREIAAYQAHHAGRGLTEVTWAWIQLIPSDGVKAMISKEGHAFELLLEDRTVVSVTLTDAQGSILANPDELTTRDRDTVAAVLLELQQQGGIQDHHVRQFGPMKISAASAPREVLLAVVTSVTDEDGAEDFIDDLLEARLEPDFVDQDIANAINDAEFAPQSRARLRRLLAAEPTLWKVRAEITPGGARRPTDAYEGIAEIETRGGRASSTFSPWGPFLSWERVEPVGSGLGDRP